MSEQELQLFNQLPDPNPQEHQQKREKTEFKDQAAKDQWDVERLIEKARVQSLDQGIAINPLDLLKRKEDDPERLRKAFAMYISNETTKFAELVKKYPSLQRYREDYDKWGNGLKIRCSWHTVQDRLLANGAHYLKLAEGLDQGGVMFGVDVEGNPLFADAGKMPGSYEKKYFEARKKTKFFDHENETPNIPTGYELFPYAPEKKKSLEIVLYEKFTGEPFVQPLGEKMRAQCWLEDGDWDSEKNKGNTMVAKYDNRIAEVNIIMPELERGDNNTAVVRKLLRLKAA